MVKTVEQMHEARENVRNRIEFGKYHDAKELHHLIGLRRALTWCIDGEEEPLVTPSEQDD